MLKLYQNKEWLEKKYLEEKLSTCRIAKECKVHNKTISRWLERFGVCRRTTGEGHHLTSGRHCNLSPVSIEWVNGELLGDASLYLASSYSALFTYASKYLEYINYISDILKSFGIEGKIYERYQYLKGTNCHSYAYRSLSYEELLSFYKEWYPENKKIVPKSIRLTPLTCCHWYIGDGTLECYKNGRPSIKLCTDGFLISDVEFLWQQLKDIGFKGNIHKSGNNFRIYISVHSVKKFLDYIGSCPVSCYQYKWAAN